MHCYAIMAKDATDSLDLRLQHRPKHLARLKQLHQQGRLLLAGPHPLHDFDVSEETAFTGSLIVAKFGSLQEALIWANADPFLLVGVYESVVVKPFIQALP